MARKWANFKCESSVLDQHSKKKLLVLNDIFQVIDIIWFKKYSINRTFNE